MNQQVNDGMMDGWMDEWVSEMHEWKDGRWLEGWVVGWMNGWVECVRGWRYERLSWINDDKRQRALRDESACSWTLNVPLRKVENWQLSGHLWLQTCFVWSSAGFKYFKLIASIYKLGAFMLEIQISAFSCKIQPVHIAGTMCQDWQGWTL